MRNKNTTILGILTIVTAVSTAVTALLDGNANTSPDWGAVAAAITAGVGLIFAKDAQPQ